MPHKPLPLATVVNIVESVFFHPESKVTKSNEKITPTNKPKHMPKKQTAILYFYKIDSAITILNFKMGKRFKVDFRGFESPKLPKQAKYIYGFVTKNHGLYNKKSPIKSDFFAVTSFLHNHYVRVEQKRCFCQFLW